MIQPKYDDDTSNEEMKFFGAAVYLCDIILIVLFYGHDVFLGSFV